MAKSTGKLLLIKVLQEEISENTLSIVVCLEYMFFKKLFLNGKLFKLPASPIHCIARFAAALRQMTTLKTVLVSRYEITRKADCPAGQKEDV